MEVLRKTREVIRYTTLAVILALGVNACASSGDSDDQGSTPTTTVSDLVDFNESVRIPLSDDWEVSDVDYLGRTEYFDGTESPESDEFMVTYENSDGQDLECLYVRSIINTGGVTVSCNWPGYNDSRPVG